YNVRATRVSAAGAVLDSAPLSFGTSYGEHGSVAFGGGTYLVVWDAGSTVAAHRVSSAGQLVGVEIVARETSTGGVLYPDVAWGGPHVFAAWQDERDGATRIYGQRIQTTGEVLDGEGFAVSSSNDAANPSIACG